MGKVGSLRFVTDPRSTQANPIVTETVYDNLNRPKTRIMPAVADLGYDAASRPQTVFRYADLVGAQLVAGAALPPVSALQAERA
ncbi:MAG: hypothetical protein ACYC35_07565 [Pirellulales bacterium]